MNIIEKLEIRIRQVEATIAAITHECEAMRKILEREKRKPGFKMGMKVHRKKSHEITQQELDDEMKRVWDGKQPNKKPKKQGKNNLKAVT